MSELPLSIAALGEDYISLWREFSCFPTRAEVFQKTRLFTPRTLANLDCQGRGPAGRLHIGGRICYPREQVVLWFAGQRKPLTKKRPDFSANLSPGSGQTDLIGSAATEHIIQKGASS